MDPERRFDRRVFLKLATATAFSVACSPPPAESSHHYPDRPNGAIREILAAHPEGLRYAEMREAALSILDEIYTHSALIEPMKAIMKKFPRTSNPENPNPRDFENIILPLADRKLLRKTLFRLEALSPELPRDVLRKRVDSIVFGIRDEDRAYQFVKWGGSPFRAAARWAPDQKPNGEPGLLYEAKYSPGFIRSVANFLQAFPSLDSDFMLVTSLPDGVAGNFALPELPEKRGIRQLLASTSAVELDGDTIITITHETGHAADTYRNHILWRKMAPPEGPIRVVEARANATLAMYPLGTELVEEVASKRGGRDNLILETLTNPLGKEKLYSTLKTVITFDFVTIDTKEYQGLAREVGAQETRTPKFHRAMAETFNTYVEGIGPHTPTYESNIVVDLEDEWIAWAYAIIALAILQDKAKSSLADTDEYKYFRILEEETGIPVLPQRPFQLAAEEPG